MSYNYTVRPNPRLDDATLENISNLPGDDFANKVERYLEPLGLYWNLEYTWGSSGRPTPVVTVISCGYSSEHLGVKGIEALWQTKLKGLVEPTTIYITDEYGVQLETYLY